MTEHTDHDNQQHGWANGSTAVLDHDTQPVVAHTSYDGHPAQPVQDDTPSVVEQPGANATTGGAARRRNRSRAATARSVVALGDLPAALHRHLQAMGPDESAHALATLRRLARIAPSADAGYAPGWLAQLGADIKECRNKAAIERLLAALCELLPAVAHPENAAAVDAVLAFADSQVAAAQAAAKRRKNSTT